jgi:hypothetical protein
MYIKAKCFPDGHRTRTIMEPASGNNAMGVVVMPVPTGDANGVVVSSNESADHQICGFGYPDSKRFSLFAVYLTDAEIKQIVEYAQDRGLMPTAPRSQ